MDIYSKAKRSALMAAVRSAGNKSTELRLASAFRAFGLRGWRRHCNLYGKPDFAFPALRIAVFVDGCFWHGCPVHYRTPASNKSFWRQKILTNVARDRAVRRALKKRGWVVLRFWEHELRLGPERV